MSAIEELTVSGSAENQSVSRADTCCSYLGKLEKLCLGWVGEGSHATVGIAASSTVTSLCIPLACVKTIFNQLCSVADGLALASETLGTNAFGEQNILLMRERILQPSFSQATVIGILILLLTASLHAAPVFEGN